jgi:hypothetical protein
MDISYSGGHLGSDDAWEHHTMYVQYVHGIHHLSCMVCASLIRDLINSYIISARIYNNAISLSDTYVNCKLQYEDWPGSGHRRAAVTAIAGFFCVINAGTDDSIQSELSPLSRLFFVINAFPNL